MTMGKKLLIDYYPQPLRGEGKASWDMGVGKLP